MVAELYRQKGTRSLGNWHGLPGQHFAIINGAAMAAVRAGTAT
jgi:hypothetical protein